MKPLDILAICSAALADAVRRLEAQYGIGNTAALEIVAAIDAIGRAEVKIKPLPLKQKQP